ncbi:DNA repair protein RecN [Flavobacterium suaedae]|uniref:DNA repair protein RecN n=1 Tax=Flavobacterium suaedae TaxID=1767027 RepID=A0ABQ1JH44_9FLAO|nr:DNA repair protein RecN [Flavobacterium suaedae]GGB68392.1 DNA repair protein RecN [Flavobacterium suaedae]
MLQTLQIKNFALIEQLNIDFSEGFSIITGETGAGKSILLGALGLVLGNRADLTSLKNKEKKCVIEAYFKIKNYSLSDFFTQNDLDYDDVTIIRREILPSGKSRAFVNDSPVNLQKLQQLGNYLIDIHSQHQTRELSDESYQKQLLDAIADNANVLKDYKSQLKAYKQLEATLAKAQEDKSNLVKEQDYNAFLLEELETAKLKAGEQEEMEAELEKLSNVEFIKESVAKVLAIASEEQIGVVQNLKEVKNVLQKISSFSEEYNQLHERVSSVLIEFDDITNELSQSSDSLIDDPEQLEQVNQKLQLIYTLQKKHQVTTVEELMTIQEVLKEKVSYSEDLDTLIEELTIKIEGAREQLNETAETISEKRREAVPVLTEKITELLALQGMPNARLKFEVTISDSYYADGKDNVVLLFSANKGTDFGTFKKVASGGEMSRVMLSVKAVLAEYSNLPTIIFDEIDTGVSGEISNKMGDIMKAMSKNMQVFAITHLPQIAGKGDTHYKVFKTTEGDNTVSELKLLSQDERVNEIAEMLSGKDISETALTHARELLK